MYDSRQVLATSQSMHAFDTLHNNKSEYSIWINLSVQNYLQVKYKNFYLVIKSWVMWAYKGEVLVFQENLHCFERAICHFNYYITKYISTDAESQEKQDETWQNNRKMKGG